MSGPAWFALGLAAGIDLTFALLGLLRHLESTVHQYVRAPGSPVVVRIKERNPA